MYKEIIEFLQISEFYNLKDKKYSAIQDLAKLTDSEFVYKIILLDNHRHPAIDNVFEMLMGM